MLLQNERVSEKNEPQKTEKLKWKKKRVAFQTKHEISLARACLRNVSASLNLGCQFACRSTIWHGFFGVACGRRENSSKDTLVNSGFFCWGLRTFCSCQSLSAKTNAHIQMKRTFRTIEPAGKQREGNVCANKLLLHSTEANANLYARMWNGK